MRRVIQIALMGMVLFVPLGCTEIFNTRGFEDNTFEDDPSISTLNGTWRVTSFENHIDQTVEYKTQENSLGLDIVVTFDDTKNPKELSGKNTTNYFQGEFSYLGNRDLIVTHYYSTEILQPSWADKFQAIMSGEVHFKINLTELRIYYHDKTKSVTLVKM